MMAVIGFLALAALGLFFVTSAIVGAFATTGFAGRIEWPHFIIFGGIGAGLLYLAITNCPFAIALTAQG